MQIEINRSLAGWAEALDPKYRYIFIKGGRSCVTGDTLLDTPNGKIPIKEFKGGYVYAWDGEKKIITAAFPSESMGKEHIFEVSLENGNKIKCTASHKFLTNHGWRDCNQLGGEDQILCENALSSSFPHRPSLKPFLSKFLLSVQRLMGIRASFLDDYLLYHHQYGQQPLLVSDNVLAFSPLRDDAQQHNSRALFRSGGMGLKYTCTPSYILHRLSNCFFPRAPSLQNYACSGNYNDGKSSGLISEFCLKPQQSLLYDIPSCKDRGWLKHHQGCAPLKYPNKIPQRVSSFVKRVFRGIGFHSPYYYSPVRLIKYIGLHEYYDIHVPIYNNYFAHGLVNHNSGKSHEVAAYLTERSFTERNLKIVCLREVQKSIKRSSKQLIDDKIKELGLTDYYKSIEAEVKKTITKDDGLFLFQGMNDLTADNVKSLEGFKIAWFEEAQNASFKTLKTLRPTIREDGSQIIFTWNPKLPTDPIDEFCASVQDEPDVLVIHVNYTENPFLSDSILREIELDKNSEDFDHIWLGGYDTSYQGHYYAKLVQQARDENRITSVPRKDGIDIITAWDLGMRDSTAIWVAQVVGLQPRIIDYYENNFEELSHYTDWIKANNYNGIHFIPHDGAHERLGMLGSIKSQMIETGLEDTRVLANNSIDSGMALAKSLLKECYIDSHKCKEGLAALSHYHAKYDEVKRTYKEVHDWSSHGSDAFRYLAQAVLDEGVTRATPRPQPRRRESLGWMA